jgi:hypothetical protein
MFSLPFRRPAGRDLPLKGFEVFMRMWFFARGSFLD